VSLNGRIAVPAVATVVVVVVVVVTVVVVAGAVESDLIPLLMCFFMF